jgi:hypothetical protein
MAFFNHSHHLTPFSLDHGSHRVYSVRKTAFVDDAQDPGYMFAQTFPFIDGKHAYFYHDHGTLLSG